jgi:hypothetical protein
MIEAFAARSGSRSLRVDGVALHSPYDPVREARRFAAEGIGAEPASTVIILGEGLGYAADAVRELLPAARVIRVHYSAEVFQAAAPADGPAWAQGQHIGLDDFLFSHIGELDMEGLRVLEWPPSARLFPAVSREANESVRRVFQQLNGSLVTTIAAGRLWIRNSIENFLAFESVLVGRPCSQDRPILIAAPGPSLEESVGLIRSVLPQVDLWALPSSLPLLRHHGLSPDLVVMTDPGHWSMHHLAFAVPDCPIAMPLSAARGAWCLPSHGAPSRVPFLLAQPGFFEEAILGAAGVKPPRIPPHGTVAATALDLALAFTDSPVVVAGLDMCTRDISFHARPNAFDTLLHLRLSRLFPYDCLMYERCMEQHTEKIPGLTGVRASLALRTYAGWFDLGAGGSAQRVYRLLPSPVALSHMRELDGEGLHALAARTRAPRRGPVTWAQDGYPDRPQRRRIVSRLIFDWLARLENAKEAIKGPPGIEAVVADPFACAMTHDIEPRLLLESRRKLRRGDPAGSRAAAAAMLENCETFLRVLEARTGVIR